MPWQDETPDRSRVQTPETPAHVPAYLRPPAGKTLTSLSRSASGPAMMRTTSGLPAQNFLNSTAIRMPPVQPMMEPRRDGITGYRGFIPGIKAETVFGTNTVKISNMASDIRPLEYQEQKVRDWNHPPDQPQMVRPFHTCEVWRELQQDPKHKWMGNELPRHTGPGIQGYGGHASCKKSPHRLQPDEAHTLGPDRRHELLRHLRSDRDCHPVDVLRPAIPGYMGFLPGRKNA
mmetsp:Transcript_22140/g.39783  ORF Transcript_22140/g.39783 Transcript_22140/m.39783 type:complete len:232 (+) Transcript_22140:48-743(+)|eukprot:CAMPEP_0197663892 /NCGR_PEP_ID=MMETSP1338-20131121/58304_1 /TAXON_ID=43686 ORGANISM="Pelagodinium beii, Strain RCC1491" /NCGR_SAMPLE_ID=MMETSP1338 /ASSEMBLY_ACC=CAM_ASM_000754 /LENGTH=231 /DNA_ID=CAMNT_0043242415 /DNA_START=42 /DNA_END=737 /DNA_ORIENTATION=-